MSAEKTILKVQALDGRGIHVDADSLIDFRDGVRVEYDCCGRRTETAVMFYVLFHDGVPLSIIRAEDVSQVVYGDGSTLDERGFTYPPSV